MAKTANNVITAVRYILQDETPVRWSDAELLGWVSDGQREIVNIKPDANAVRANITCVTGTYQTLPANGIRLLDVVRNVNGRRIRRVDRYVMDIEDPNWHESTPSAAVDHFIFEEEVPDAFYVYPPQPATLQGSITIVYSALPAAVTDGDDTLELDDAYFSAIVDYVAYRCFMKDTEFDNQAQKADAHYAAFLQALGVKASAETVHNPNRSA